MHDPTERALKELTEDRCGFVEDLHELEMGVWGRDEDDEDEERDRDE